MTRGGARRSGVWRTALAIGAATAVALVPAILASAPTEAQVVEDPRPNVVVIMTDDQHVGSLPYMPAVQALIAEQGTSFENAFTTTPLCCPSRATFLTGQYAHNHGVKTNSEPDGGYHALDQSETLPVWLQRAGYATAHVGKFLNGYGKPDPTVVPSGWSEWYGSVDNTTFRMYDYTLNENGSLVDYGNDPGDYQTDVYADKAVEFIGRRAPAAEPFFLSVATLAPHLEAGRTGPRPAPRHVGAFAQQPVPRPPSFDEEDVSDKPGAIRALPRFDTATIDAITARYRARLESLLAVDDLVADVVTTLEAAGELDQTLIVFTSDNGYLHGEHRVPKDKRYPYEESIRVPLIVRGPGVPAGAIRTAFASNVDLAPTILDVAGATAGNAHVIDGISLMPVAENPAQQVERTLLLEYWRDPGTRLPGYFGVRTPTHVFVSHRPGEKELYDLAADPFQLDSRHADPGYEAIRTELAQQVRWLKDCLGRLCNSREPQVALELAYAEGQTGGGHRCVESPVVARVAGGDPDGVIRRVDFKVGARKVGSDPDPPYEHTIPATELREQRWVSILARVRLGYGRSRTLEEAVPRACP